jgi:glutaredoxin
MAKKYFDSKKVAYKEIDVSVDRDAAKWVMDHIGQIVTPVIDINGTVVLGFDRPKIDAALRQ